MTRHLIALATVAVLITWPGARAKAQAKPASVSGAWQVSMQGQGAAVTTQALSIVQKGGAISGTLKAPQGVPVTIQGTVNGTTIAFTVKRQTPDGNVTQQFAGTVKDDAISGTVTQGEFHVNWTAARAKRQVASH
jgi:hypothetical protein